MRLKTLGRDWNGNWNWNWNNNNTPHNLPHAARCPGQMVPHTLARALHHPFADLLGWAAQLGGDSAK